MITSPFDFTQGRLARDILLSDQQDWLATQVRNHLTGKTLSSGEPCLGTGTYAREERETFLFPLEVGSLS